MITMKFTRTISFFLLLFCCSRMAAQESILISTTIEKNKILIGEQVRLTVEAIIPANEPIRFISIDSILHFEVLHRQIDTINTSTGTTIKGIYTITSFDSGHWVIPSFLLTDKVMTDTIPVDVIFSDFNPQQEYHDVKDILEVEVKEKDQWWWYLAAGGFVLLLLLVWLLLRRKKPVPVVKQEVAADPYKEAIAQLALLQKNRPGEKEFYSRLTDIFRLYIYRRKGILSLQKTTDDLVVQLRNLEMNKEQFNQLSQSLRLSDFVKFAKYIPSEDDNRKVFDTIKNSIEEIERVK